MTTKHHIPLVDLKPPPDWGTVAYERLVAARAGPAMRLSYEVRDALTRVHRSGVYVNGPEVEAFEAEWATYCKAKYCVGLSSGSDALYLTLRYCKDVLWKDYDTVATTPVSFWATVESVMRAGLEPQFYDIEDHGCVDLEKAKDMPDDVWLPVNLYGYPAPIPTGASTGLLPIIEDAAQSHGQPLRGWAACHSFYPTKNLGAMGQAGAVVTNDEELAKWLRHMRGHAEVSGQRFVHDAMSGNWRMDEIQAAVLRAKLPYLTGWNQRRREIAVRYRAGLAGVPGISLLPDHPNHVYHIFGVRIGGGGSEVHYRDSLLVWLSQHGIETGIRYPVPLYKMGPDWFYKGLVIDGERAHSSAWSDTRWPNANSWCNEVLNLPIYPELQDGQVDEVVAAIREWVEGGK